MSVVDALSEPQSHSQHVVPNLQGGWSVLKGGATRATRRFASQQEAIRFATAMSQRLGLDLYVHKRDGTVLRKDSFALRPGLVKEVAGA